ncbi:MAG TPA: segregation/condensation protein A [Acidobacteriaceae bacterium]|nr:segregation/condensation protein A [Acidobacteriaceae bacterium]
MSEEQTPTAPENPEPETAHAEDPAPEIQVERQAAPAEPKEPGKPAKAEKRARQEKAQAKSEAVESVSPFTITVGRVYEGPMDLLLDLIRKQDIDIYDIPIAKITAQFLAYVEGLKQTDIDAAGEFIYVASLLIQIKSRMLLPREPVEAEGESEDPRRELVERLLEHERFQRAAQMLLQKQQIEEATWTNPAIRQFQDAEGTEREIAADTVDLVRVFREILERAKQRPFLNVDEEAVTVGQMLDFVRRRMIMEDKPVPLRSLLRNTRSERALICMFLALLEMVRLQAILLRQDRTFGEVYIKKHPSFDSVLNDRLTQMRDDWR